MFKAFAILTKKGHLVVNDKNIPYLVPFTKEARIEIERFYEDMVQESKEWESYYIGVIEEVVNE